MDIRTIYDPLAFLAALGGLHDVEINDLMISIDGLTLRLGFEDINANFTELPEYQGCRVAILVFSSVTALFMDVDINEGICISSAKIIREDQKFRSNIDLRVGYGSVTEGRPKITEKFESLQIQDVR